MTLLINTSNKNKQREYTEYLDSLFNIQFINKDVNEPCNTDDITVVAYKASQFNDNTIVEDVALYVKDAPPGKFGIYIKYQLPDLDNYIGSDATFSCLIGIKKNNKVYVYKGSIEGKVVAKKGEGFGFDPNFLPNGTDKTLGEYKDPRYNARAIAIKDFIDNKVFAERDVIEKWNGIFQE